MRCQAAGKARWCEIEILSDMRERGWVNARYLTAGSATHLPGDALVPGTGYNATGQIRCTNLPGNAMFDCTFGVQRKGNGDATLVVTFPTGNTRIIIFAGGQPVRSDVAAALRYSRVGDVVTIRIGHTERFVIPDAIPFGG